MHEFHLLDDLVIVEAANENFREIQFVLIAFS